MSDQNIKVFRVDAISDFRASLCTFGEDAKNALGAVDMEVRRTLDWLKREQKLHWEAQIKRARLDVAEAQATLFRKKISHKPTSPAHDSDEREALREAKRRLSHAEEKLEKVKKWIPALETAVAQYRSRSQPLSDVIEGDLQKSVRMLDRMVAAIDAYLKTAPPSLPPSQVLAGIDVPGVAAPAPSGGEADCASASGGEAPAAEAPRVEEAAPEQAAGGGAAGAEELQAPRRAEAEEALP
jgi:hypothetical protein